MYVRLTPSEQYHVEDATNAPARLQRKITNARRRRAEMNCIKVRVTTQEYAYLRRTFGPFWTGD